MGLLDDLLAQVAGGGRMPASTTRAEAGSGAGGMGSIVAALLPVVMAMMSGKGSGSGSSVSARAATAGGGGLGDVLGQILGGGSSTGGRGGLGDLLDQFQRAGFGEQARSWVGTGQNIPISPDDLGQVFGQGGISEIARRAGLTERQASEGLSQILPDVVDRVTPNGEVPADDGLVASVDALTRRLGLG
jgi:uncharacterized protein YidB (DUF937 family)